ncbi:MAG: glycosyltransferase, partial [Parvularculaceae bacterium]|nr:glycosyltransferase [Parvularculaceae bacterium]
MRILTLTTLYPNAAAPHHGVFVENRLRAFQVKTGAEIRVVAPVPWFPFDTPLAGKYAVYARAPRRETRHGLAIDHPRYLLPPKVGMTYAARSLERAFLRAAEEARFNGFDFDVVDAHYFYPDGVAAAAVAKRFDKPLVVTARGTDVNFLPRYPRQRRMILDAARDADAIIAVADALKSEMVSLGIPAHKIDVLRNGVDLGNFRLLDRAALRRAAGLEGRVIASVGHLIERKGHHLVIDALAALPETTLLIAGDGEERARLAERAARAGVAGRVRFLGRLPHERLTEVYNMADALVLASSREGWPNVLLEAMASGAPVAATDIWGSGEVVRAPEAGRLIPERTAPAIASTVDALLKAPPPREAVRQYAERHSWDETSERLDSLFRAVVRRPAMRPLRLAPPPRPKLLVTVDTEEEFDWQAIDNERHVVCDPADIDRFQRLAAAAGARPLYFLTYPVVMDDKACAYFRGLLETGRADLGVHLHQWVTPPLAEGQRADAASWQCNIAPEAQLAKLRTLVEAFEARLKLPARAHRAGRYGVDRAAFAPIAAAGVEFDFSPAVGFDYSAAGGPDFSGMSNAPFVVL